MNLRGLIGKKLIIRNMILEENSTDTLDWQKGKQWVPEQIKPKTLLEVTLTKLKLSGTS